MPTATRTTLDFIIVGAEKAGTTFLSKTLRQSSEVYIPERETRHFRNPFYPEREKLDDIFAGKEGVKLGIKHPSYLGREEVPERIHQHNPAVKLIVILRNPVERAISSYLHYINHGQIPLVHPNEGLQTLFDLRRDVPKYNDILEFGLYFKYIRLYLTHFNRENMLILEFEDFFKGDVPFSRVTDFLGIAPIASVPRKPVNEGTYNWNECILSFARALMFNAYDDLLNIVGPRRHPYLESYDREWPNLKLEMSTSPVRIRDEVRRLLHDFYKDDMNALKSSGIFKPVNW
jgi:hypothetical protein